MLDLIGEQIIKTEFCWYMCVVHPAVNQSNNCKYSYCNYIMVAKRFNEYLHYLSNIFTPMHLGKLQLQPGMEPQQPRWESTMLTTAPTNLTHYTTLKSTYQIFLALLIFQFGVVYSVKEVFLNLKMFIFYVYSVRSRQLQGE